MNESNPVKKYEELYELTKSGLADELEGIRQLEEKASRYLSVMGVLLGISSLGVKLVIEAILPTRTFFDGLVTGILVFFLLLAFCTILTLFTVFKTKGLSHFPINNELIEFFNKNNYLDSIFALTRGNVDAVQTNRSVRLDKIRRLSYGYILMILSIAFLALFTCSLIARPYARSWTTKSLVTRSSSMGDEKPSESKPSESKPSETKPSSSAEPKPDTSVQPPNYDTILRMPDPSVKPPKYEVFKEGYDRRAGTGNQGVDKAKKDE